MTTIHDCQAGRLTYISARILEAEVEVQRLRQLIDRLSGDCPSITEDVSRLIGQIDEVHHTLSRARDVCQALLATDGEAGR